MAILTNAEQQKALSHTVICAIGTTTYQACLAAGLTVNIMPTEYTVEGLARAIDSFYAPTSSGWFQGKLTCKAAIVLVK